MHMLRTHLRGRLLWKCKVRTLSRVYACAFALLFHCSFNVFEETEGSETEAFSKRFDGWISQFFFVQPTFVISHFSFFSSRLSTDNQDSMFKAIEALSKRLDSLGTNMERNLNLVNVNVMNMSERTTALEMKGMHIYIDFQLGLYCFALLQFVIGLWRKLGPLSQTRRCKAKNKSDSMLNISPTCGCSRWVTNPPLWHHFPTQLNLY